jgi:hypothetical protein
MLLYLNVCRVLRLQPGHKFCLLGRLSEEVGWHHYDTIKVCIPFGAFFKGFVDTLRKNGRERTTQETFRYNSQVPIT